MTLPSGRLYRTPCVCRSRAPHLLVSNCVRCRAAMYSSMEAVERPQHELKRVSSTSNGQYSSAPAASEEHCLQFDDVCIICYVIRVDIYKEAVLKGRSNSALPQHCATFVRSCGCRCNSSICYARCPPPSPALCLDTESTPGRPVRQPRRCSAQWPSFKRRAPPPTAAAVALLACACLAAACLPLFTPARITFIPHCFSLSA